MRSRGRDRRWTERASSLVLALALALPSGLAAAGDNASPRLSTPLAEKARGGGNADEMVDVIVALDGTSAAPDHRAAARLGGRMRREYRRLPFRAMRVPARELQALSNTAGVRFVSADTAVFAASLPARQTARVPGSTAALNTPNVAYKGAGVTVAVLDSGVWHHPDFYALQAQFDFVNGQVLQTGALDPFGHGTHVAGMIGATGSGSAGGTYQGVATQARLVALRVLDDQGRGRLSDVLNALDWLLDVGIARYNIRVANLSFGKGVEEAQALDPLVRAVEAVWDAGVTVVVSAGNYGGSGHYTIGSPGNSRKVITVGSLTDGGTGTLYLDDYVSSFSSRGPTLFDHVLKPDLVAPGNRVIAPHAAGARLDGMLPPDRVLCGSPTPGCYGNYLRLSGTSMAAAEVSGAVARMLSKYPSLTPATVKARLMKSARKIPGDPTMTGTGVLDVEAAMNATGTISGAALSPLMLLSAGGTIVQVQNTAQLWGGSQWSAAYLWSDGYLWSSAAPLAASGYLWSEASLWADSSLWADTYLWSDGFLWSEAVRPASIDVEDPDSH